MISGKAFAAQLGVALATLSQAVAKGHLCRGVDVSALAVRGPSGRVMGYEVPVSVTARLTPLGAHALSGDGRSGGSPANSSSLPVRVLYNLMASSRSQRRRRQRCLLPDR